MAPVPTNFVMGVNFSNNFQSTPIDPNTAASQIEQIVPMVKTFSLSPRDLAFLDAASGRFFHCALGTTNQDMESFARSDTQAFINKIRPYVRKICWICVGNEPLGSWYSGKYNGTLVPAVQNLYMALRKEGWNDIGVTIPQNFEFMGASYPPSQGAIKQDLQSIIRGTCEVMRSSRAPFMVNIYPFLTRRQNRNDVPLDYCLFTAQQNHWVYDGSYTYKNIFDAMIDALHVALGKIGYGDLEIVIGECGWPTAGDQDANPSNAQTFLQNMIKHCRSGSGTPRIPGKKIRCFVFEMYDEDKKDQAPGPFEPHWGVRYGNGESKFALNWHADD